MTIEITEEFARRVLSVVDAGLVAGMGTPIPGAMCVEAAVAFASGEGHHDRPICVSPTLGVLKIWLNDLPWYRHDHDANHRLMRARGMRRLAIAQLGSRGSEKEFSTREFCDHLTALCKLNYIGADWCEWCVFSTTRTWPIITTALMSLLAAMGAFAVRKWPEGFQDHQKLMLVAELFVQCLVRMEIPGTKFLYLTEVPEEIRGILQF
jgi:hypothetical protein